MNIKTRTGVNSRSKSMSTRDVASSYAEYPDRGGEVTIYLSVDDSDMNPYVAVALNMTPTEAYKLATHLIRQADKCATVTKVSPPTNRD